MANSPQTSIVHRLPLEIVQKILSNLPQVQHLPSAILSCRALHDSFISAEPIIVRAILVRQIHPSLVPSARLADEAWRIGSFCEHNASFWVTLAEELKSDQQPPQHQPLHQPLHQWTWTLRRALPLAERHVHVSWFADSLAQRVLDEQPGLRRSGPSSDMNEDENNESPYMTEKDNANANANSKNNRPSGTETRRFTAALYHLDALVGAASHPRYWPGRFSEEGHVEIDDVEQQQQQHVGNSLPRILQGLPPSQDMSNYCLTVVRSLNLLGVYHAMAPLPLLFLATAPLNLLCIFSKWETEQIDCIRRLLARLLAPVVNDLVAHDVVWGALRIPAITHTGASLDSILLHLGLSTLYRLLNEPTPALGERIARNLAGRWHETYLAHTPESLTANVRHTVRMFGAYGHVCNKKLLGTTELGTPFFVETDAGPAEACRARHPGYTVGGGPRAEIDPVQWGYVLWDYERLDRFGALDQGTRIRAIVKPRGDGKMPSSLARQSLTGVLGRTQQERWNILKRNGRGRWYPRNGTRTQLGDESEVSYLAGDLDKVLDRFAMRLQWTLELGSAS